MKRDTGRALCFLLAFLLLTPQVLRCQGIITTVAGSTWVFRGDGGPATNVPLGWMAGVAVDSAGNVFASDSKNCLVVKISLSGVLRVVAGNGLCGFSGDGGPATAASLGDPGGVAVDAAGNIYVADTDNNSIRRVSPAGTITTVAGSGDWQFSGDGGPATAAGLRASGVAVDAAGNIYVADTDNHRIRKVSPTGTITTVAGNGVGGFSGDGGPATATSLFWPSGVAVDAAGSIYIADSTNNRIRKVSPTGTITTVAGNGYPGYSGDGGVATAASLLSPLGLALDAAGNIYIAGQDRIRKVSPVGIITTVAGNGVGGFSGDGGPATAASLGPWGVAVDAAGNLYIADLGNERVRKVSAAGIITTLAGSGTYRYSGDGGLATSASLNSPSGVAVDAADNIYVADTENNRFRKVSPAGNITTVAGNGVEGFSGDGGPATGASLGLPEGVAVDAAGNIYVADTGNSRIRKVSPAGIITTVAGSGSAAFSGDGGPATSASLYLPYGVAVDAAGNLYIADTDHERIRRVTPGGTITTIAGGGKLGFSGDGGPATGASLDTPYGVAVDAAGNIYVADSENNRIRKVSPAGIITTVAGNGTSGFSGDGGPATGASLNLPCGVAVDAAGNIYIADSDNSRVRKVSPVGTITTVAGNGDQNLSGDGGLATAASLDTPYGVAVDAAGNLYIADTGNDRIRKVLAAAPSFTASPSTLSFSAAAGSASVAPQQIALSGTVAGLGWTATARTSSGGAWLSVSPASGQMPSAISVSVNAASLAAGSYQGAIDISSPGASPALVTVAVALTVSAAQSASLAVQPARLSFAVLTGASAPPAQVLSISNAGGGTLSWMAQATTTTGNWLKLGTTSGTAPADVQASVSLPGLTAGSYAGSIVVQSPTTNQSVTVPVSLAVSNVTAALLLSSTSLFFRAVQDGGADPPQQFGVLNIGSGSLDWSALPTVSWLKLSPASGQGVTATGQIPMVDVSVDPTGLRAGMYAGLIRVTSSAANNSPQVLKVDLQVLSAGTPLGAVVRPSGLIFRGVAGSSSPGSQNVVVYTTAPSSITFLSNTFDADWVKLSPGRNDGGAASRDTPGKIVVQPDLTSLAPQVYRGGLAVYTRNDQNQYPVSLLFVVLPSGTVLSSARHEARSHEALSDEDWEIAAAAGCTARQLILQFASLFSTQTANLDTFYSGVGAPLLVNARDDCGNPAVGGSVRVSFDNGDSDLNLVDLRNGQYMASWRPGPVGGSTRVTAKGGWNGLAGQTSTQVMILPPQSLYIQALLNQGGVVQAAGYAHGPVAPGSIVALFGQNLAAGDNQAPGLPLPARLGGVRVLIGDREAPLFYSGSGQVNAQVPFELAADRQLQALIEANGQPSAPEPLQTVASSPGIFTLDPKYGKQQGAILIANTNRLAMPARTDVPSEPAKVGGIVSIFCTGLGATQPAVASGQAPPAGTLAVATTTPTVLIGNKPAQVSFAGLAPGFAGLYQVNAQVPEGVAAGDEVPVVITQGGLPSNVVTVAVR